MIGSQGKAAVRASSVTKGLLYNPDNVGDVWRWYMLAFGMNDDLPSAPLTTRSLLAARIWPIVLGGLYTALSLAWWLEWGKPLARALGIPCGGKHGRVLVGAVIPVLIGFLYFSYSPQVELVIYGSARYLMFAMPGLAIIAGLGAGALMAIGRGRRVAQAITRRSGGVGLGHAGLGVGHLASRARQALEPARPRFLGLPRPDPQANELGSRRDGRQVVGAAPSRSQRRPLALREHLRHRL